MKIRRITVKNFRSLRCVDIKVNQTPLVILGENNVGKSNILLALRLLLGEHAQRLQLDLSEEDINKTARLQNELFFHITLEIGELQKHPDVEACFKERIDTDGEEHFVRIQGLYKQNADGDFEWRSVLLPQQNRANDSKRFTNQMHKAIPLFFMDAIRDGEREIRATGTGILSKLLQDVDYNDVADEVLSRLKEANVALNRSKEIRSMNTDLTHQLGNLVPGGQEELSISAANEDMSLLARSLRLTIRKRPDEQRTTLSRQGTGLQNLVLITIFRHLMQMRQEDTWKKTPILAIEEPESHLHPHTQRRLYKELCEINVPVIVTTHSPALVKYADPSSLVILRSDTPDQALAYQLSSSFQSESKKQLSQLMNLDGAEVFFSKIIIAVEGDSELIALPAFAEQLGCDLDREGISILNVGSTTSFEPILRAFTAGELSVKSVVIYDQDVLRKNPNLVKQAVNLGLVSKSDYQSCRKHRCNVFDDRVSLLNNQIGWFGATESFEQEIWNGGYSDLIIQILKDNREYSNWENFASSNDLQCDGTTFASFVKKDNKKYLKLLIAHAVSDAVQTIESVPDCFASAIRHATLLSLGGIVVDENFEIRACAAGFRSIFFEFFEGCGLTASFQSFADENPHLSESVRLQLFFSRDDASHSMRDKARLVIAKAVDHVGCPDFADRIRNTGFPSPVD